MEINIYEDFLSKPEIEFLTGRKNKLLIIKQLNAMGIPFKENAHGYPIVRRDYEKTKSQKIKLPESPAEESWVPAVLT